jgi:hypothetical protein
MRYFPPHIRDIQKIVILAFIVLATLCQGLYRLVETSDPQVAKAFWSPSTINSVSLKTAPLSPYPLIKTAVSQIKTDQNAPGEKLLLAAQRRAPRNALIAQVLADQYVSRHAYAEAIEQLDLLIRIEPDNSSTYLDILKRLSAKPAAHPGFIAAMQHNPVWAKRFASHIIDEGIYPAFAIELTREFSDHHTNKKTVTLLQEQLLSTLVSNLAYKQAETLLAEFTHSPAPDKAMNASGFGPTKTLKPFHWRLSATDKGFAEYTENNSLYVSFLPAADVFLADKIVLLDPHWPHELIIETQELPDKRKGYLSVSLICHERWREITRLVLTPDDFFEPGLYKKRFVITGEKCAAQRLSINGHPGDYIARAEAVLHSVTIMPADAAP